MENNKKIEGTKLNLNINKLIFSKLKEKYLENEKKENEEVVKSELLFNDKIKNELDSNNNFKDKTFPCNSEGCNKFYSNLSRLEIHQRTHVIYSLKIRQEKNHLYVKYVIKVLMREVTLKYIIESTLEKDLINAHLIIVQKNLKHTDI